MQSLKALSQELLADPAFRELFDKECHVCTSTMRIFARMYTENRKAAEIAQALGVDPASVGNLATAEYCDPHLVVRLCQHLDLPVPVNCPRMTAKQV